MKTFRLLFVLLIATLLTISCEDDTDCCTVPGGESIEVPATYTFEREGENTVIFSGQTTRIQMGEELNTALLNFDTVTAQSLLDMFANANSPFDNPDLNASTKSIKSKVAASVDYFATNAAASSAIRAAFDSWLTAQAEVIFPARNQAASPGVAGQLPDGSSTRYVDEKGFEFNQLVIKGLIGALMTDQALNNYLSVAVLDEGTNREDNDADAVTDGQVYTKMEHKWDEAYGYVFGNSPDASNPLTTLGDDDSFINKYLGRLEGDDDFAGAGQRIFEAFKLGRAAIVAKNYEVRDAQAAIIKKELSDMIGIRAVYYLQQAIIGLDQDVPAFGTAFHDLSEGYGFIYSLQFTQNPATGMPYFSSNEVAIFLEQLEGGNGLWEVSIATLESMSQEIAARFDWTVEQAGS